MSKIPDVTRQDGVIHQGATFFWEVALYEDADHTVPTSLTGMTPTATLMTPKGAHDADFSCAILDATADKPQRVALVLPKAITSAKAHGQRFLYNLDLVDAEGAAYRKLIGELTVERGQVTT